MSHIFTPKKQTKKQNFVPDRRVRPHVITTLESSGVGVYRSESSRLRGCRKVYRTLMSVRGNTDRQK